MELLIIILGLEVGLGLILPIQPFIPRAHLEILEGVQLPHHKFPMALERITLSFSKLLKVSKQTQVVAITVGSIQVPRFKNSTRESLTRKQTH